MLSSLNAFTWNCNDFEVWWKYSKDKKQTENKQRTNGSIASENSLKAWVIRKEQRVEDKILVKLHKGNVKWVITRL